MIDVIVPLYRGLDESRRCLDAVRAATNRTPFELVLVDDASPEPEVSALARDVSQRHGATLLVNEANRGFVHSVNRAMALHADRDVVLLNSDAEVANDWLDRLVAHAARDPAVATVTPFSNNATICSYPHEGWEGGVPGGLGLARLDALFARVLAGRAIEIPTAVGFCMYIRRAALAQVGLFDEEQFGRGYGEENDFCLRATKAGWKHLLACDVFVFHAGGVSFSRERAALAEAAMRKLCALHPEYPATIEAFQARDPVAECRQRIDAARGATGEEEALAVARERATERAALLARVEELTRLCRSLGESIERMQGQTETREQILARELDHARAEEAALRTGLANAETLAISRLAELERLKAMWSVRLAEKLERLKP